MSASIPSPASKLSLSTDMPAKPEVKRTPVSTDAAMDSSCSSIWSPVRVAVPPDLITAPAIDASPILSGGSSIEPVPILAVRLIKGSS